MCSGLADIIDRKGNKKRGKTLHDHWPFYIWNVIICSQCTEVIASFDKGHMEYRMDKAVHCHYVGHRVINSIYCFHEYIIIIIIIGTCDTTRKSVCRKSKYFRWRLDQRIDIYEYDDKKLSSTSSCQFTSGRRNLANWNCYCACIEQLPKKLTFYSYWILYNHEVGYVILALQYISLLSCLLDINNCAMAWSAIRWHKSPKPVNSERSWTGVS